MKTKVVFMAILFAMSNLVFSTNINDSKLEMNELERYRVSVDCDGDGNADYSMVVNSTYENAVALGQQMLDSCD